MGKPSEISLPCIRPCQLSLCTRVTRKSFLKFKISFRRFGEGTQSLSFYSCLLSGMLEGTDSRSFPSCSQAVDATDPGSRCCIKHRSSRSQMLPRAEGGTVEHHGLKITTIRLKFASERQVREVGDTPCKLNYTWGFETDTCISLRLYNCLRYPLALCFSLK